MARILFAEDDVAMRDMVCDLMRAAGHAVEQATDGLEAWQKVRSELPDLVLLDYRMAGISGFEVCRRVKEDPATAHLPVLILTGEGSIEHRIRGFEAGADDYLSKPFDARELVARVKALLRLSEQGRDLNPTTGLPGGASIDREFDRRRTAGKPFTLCYLDLNDFKSFNDQFGFSTANSVIASIGRSMRQAVAGTTVFAGHVGGDDFVLMCRPSEARPLVAKIRSGLDATLADLVPREIVASGVYLGRRRSGAADYVALTRLLGVLLHLRGPGDASPSLAELGEVAAEAKGRAKTAPDGLLEVEVESRAEDAFSTTTELNR